jgi:hypothetical protein
VCGRFPFRPGVSFHDGIGGNTINGSLWSLPFEFRFYSIILIVGALPSHIFVQVAVPHSGVGDAGGTTGVSAGCTRSRSSAFGTAFLPVWRLSFGAPSS